MHFFFQRQKEILLTHEVSFFFTLSPKQRQYKQKTKPKTLQTNIHEHMHLNS